MALQAPRLGSSTNPGRDRIINALLSVGRHEVRQRWGANSCIAMTKVVVDVLTHYGYAARPLVVEARAFNRVAAEAIEAGAQGMVDGAYGVSLGADERGRQGLHLVTLLDDLLIDGSLDQISRPGWQLTAYPSVFVLNDPAAFAAGDEEVWFDLPGGGVIGYRVRPRRRRYISSPNWGNRDAHLRRHVIDRVVAQLSTPLIAGLVH